MKLVPIYANSIEQLTYKTKIISYLLLIVCSTIILLLQYQGIKLYPIINNYCNDFISMTLTLKICSLILKKLYGFILVDNIGYMLIIWLYYGFVFEIIFPFWYTRYTFDFFDFIAYFLGLILFLILECYDYKKMFKMWNFHR